MSGIWLARKKVSIYTSTCAACSWDVYCGIVLPLTRRGKKWRFNAHWNRFEICGIVAKGGLENWYFLSCWLFFDIPSQMFNDIFWSIQRKSETSLSSSGTRLMNLSLIPQTTLKAPSFSPFAKIRHVSAASPNIGTALVCLRSRHTHTHTYPGQRATEIARTHAGRTRRWSWTSDWWARGLMRSWALGRGSR